jgi:hypothetical protein
MATCSSAAFHNDLALPHAQKICRGLGFNCPPAWPLSRAGVTIWLSVLKYRIWSS